jgi:hypothetical protein
MDQNHLEPSRTIQNHREFLSRLFFWVEISQWCLFEESHKGQLTKDTAHFLSARGQLESVKVAAGVAMDFLV